jgi:sulfofructose kinase
MKFNQNTKYDIVGIGATPLDTLMIIENFPNGREVHPTLDFICSSGGPVGTALSTASKLGSKTIMIDKISDDIIGKSILSDYLKYDVDTSYIQIEKNKQSASATILVKKSTGDRAIYFTPSTTTELSDISPFIDVIKNSKILHINGRHKQILSDAITIAKNYNVKISFDGGANRYNEFNDLLAQKSDICILAKDFANKYTNRYY